MNRIRSISLFLGCLLFVSNVCHGHVVSQMLLTLERDKQNWSVIVVVDAAYALPEFRNDADAPQPPRSWLVQKTPREHLQLKQEAESYLRESLAFYFSNSPLRFAVSFPDYDHSPPSFPSLLNGGAYFNVKLSGTIPEGVSGNFNLEVKSGDRPNFIFTSKRQGVSSYLIVSPGESKTIFSTSSSGIDHVSEPGLFSILKLGYIHVIPDGLDHFLFILALFLIVRNWKPLLTQSLIFTLAHSVTLGLAVSGIIQIRQWPIAWLIEPFIALSIALVALDNIFRKEASASRLAVIFMFGLIHGLGFAGSLGASLQSNDGWLIPLCIANLGVELAQITILAAAWILTIGWWKSDKYRKFTMIASGLIAAVGGFWTIERLFSA